VGYAEISWNFSDLELVLRTWQDYTLPEAEDRFTSNLRISLKLQPQLLMQGGFLGPARDLRHLMRPLLRAGSPQNVTIEEIP
jgi:hypothetical protein